MKKFSEHLTFTPDTGNPCEDFGVTNVRAKQLVILCETAADSYLYERYKNKQTISMQQVLHAVAKAVDTWEPESPEEERYAWFALGDFFVQTEHHLQQSGGLVPVDGAIE